MDDETLQRGEDLTIIIHQERVVIANSTSTIIQNDDGEQMSMYDCV